MARTYVHKPPRLVDNDSKHFDQYKSHRAKFRAATKRVRQDTRYRHDWDDYTMTNDKPAW